MFEGAGKDAWCQDILFNPKKGCTYGREAKGGLVCLERKMYDRSNKSYLTEDVKKANIYIELIAEFAHIWKLGLGL